VKVSELSTAIGSQWRGSLSFFSSSYLFKSSSRLAGCCRLRFTVSVVVRFTSNARVFQLLTFVILHCDRLRIDFRRNRKGRRKSEKHDFRSGVGRSCAVYLRVFIRTPLSEWSIADRKRVETKRTEADAAYQFRQDTDVIASLSGRLVMTLLYGGLGNLSSLAQVGFYLIVLFGPNP
jgi:hypothetical protein